ncbi:hypothetical protein GOODEAATRI_013796 [Goodea atripinnis]|uniref:Uncharacterized protein n=1 Tax=Goodea atripinnis TaxID=208336 RepID=A0ABV0PXT1_9TELE
MIYTESVCVNQRLQEAECWRAPSPREAAASSSVMELGIMMFSSGRDPPLSLGQCHLSSDRSAATQQELLVD